MYRQRRCWCCNVKQLYVVLKLGDFTHAFYATHSLSVGILKINLITFIPNNSSSGLIHCPNVKCYGFPGWFLTCCVVSVRSPVIPRDGAGGWQLCWGTAAHGPSRLTQALPVPPPCPGTELGSQTLRPRSHFHRAPGPGDRRDIQGLMVTVSACSCALWRVCCLCLKIATPPVSCSIPVWDICSFTCWTGHNNIHAMCRAFLKN